MLPSTTNLVVLASNYNPSIVSKEWLRQKAIFTEPIGNFLHTPVFALSENDNYILTVDEGRFQITVKKITEDRLNAMTAIAERFIETLPETPYKAIGMNYQYHVSGERYDLYAILSPDNQKISELASPEYELGATLRFQFEKFIVNLTIQPLLGKQQQFRVGFNFHSDTATVDEIKDRLASQAVILEKAEKIIQGLSKNG